ncbi:hypothetical protein IFM89_015145 [Coptis chinensis]|uniref:Uncharacterized protein n=1 Tax=Coptis chinensis TaxID=261450 RepID=A0A835HVT7_9MAGN|nr:hypothetical protein IFM89_015145 [Coptis chinensis]
MFFYLFEFHLIFIHLPQRGLRDYCILAGSLILSTVLAIGYRGTLKVANFFYLQLGGYFVVVRYLRLYTGENVPLEACMHKIPVDASERGSQWPKQWSARAEKVSYWLKSSQVGVYGKAAPEDFVVDYEHWKHVTPVCSLECPKGILFVVESSLHLVEMVHSKA